ncbi:GNAT family N-acetyltransferase [Marivirga salinae]|uniref:GNAT family N-acetyltransferase n=1 Tax=Marivirga salinarum TaxID=3059078 RepID=A0AA51NCK9_9BACT|nr:GNAT family N-acetyltransferase [Marivirga sp. BDSF4-3]WMN12474.1 GNAT family N-acetyltransferase [Marivirga sp. BDSF4-3]
MSSYKVLSKQKFESDGYSIVPIRMEDRYAIMKWRNEQIYHLRQDKPLAKESQDNYFNKVIVKLFEQEKPAQILFSYLKDNHCIGYGGLVHINWVDKNAEVSFIMKTELEVEEFNLHWKSYLNLIEKVAFEELDFHKLYVYAFDLRPHLYDALKDNKYFLDARLRDHCYFEGEYKDVVIYSKLEKG